MRKRRSCDNRNAVVALFEHILGDGIRLLLVQEKIGADGKGGFDISAFAVLVELGGKFTLGYREIDARLLAFVDRIVGKLDGYGQGFGCGEIFAVAVFLLAKNMRRGGGAQLGSPARKRYLRRLERNAAANNSADALFALREGEGIGDLAVLYTSFRNSVEAYGLLSEKGFAVLGNRKRFYRIFVLELGFYGDNGFNYRLARTYETAEKPSALRLAEDRNVFLCSTWDLDGMRKLLCEADVSEPAFSLAFIKQIAKDPSLYRDSVFRQLTAFAKRGTVGFDYRRNVGTVVGKRKIDLELLFGFRGYRSFGNKYFVYGDSYFDRALSFFYKNI